MRNFAVTTKAGGHILGVGIGDVDFIKLKMGEPIAIDLESVGIGFWSKNQDGARSFIQPRDSTIVVFPGDRQEDIEVLLGFELPNLKQAVKDVKERTESKSPGEV